MEDVPREQLAAGDLPLIDDLMIPKVQRLKYTEQAVVSSVLNRPTDIVSVRT